MAAFPTLLVVGLPSFNCVLRPRKRGHVIHENGVTCTAVVRSYWCRFHHGTGGLKIDIAAHKREHSGGPTCAKAVLNMNYIV